MLLVHARDAMLIVAVHSCPELTLYLLSQWDKPRNIGIPLTPVNLKVFSSFFENLQRTTYSRSFVWQTHGRFFFQRERYRVGRYLFSAKARRILINGYSFVYEAKRVFQEINCRLEVRSTEYITKIIMRG